MARCSCSDARADPPWKKSRVLRDPNEYARLGRLPAAGALPGGVLPITAP